MSAELEQRLLELGRALDFPPAPDLAAAVLARLPDRRAGRRSPVRRALVLGLGVALLLGGTAMAVPTSRDAILRVLGLRGVRIERVPKLPALPASAGTKLGLGERIPPSRARHAAGFAALLPASATAVYLGHDVPGGRISLLVGRALVIELRGNTAPFILKLISASTQHTLVRVNGGPGVYLFGAPHELVFLPSSGGVQADRVRLAGNVLLWQQGPLTLRIEGTHTLKQALALARSLR
jgi:hypothetical protein